MHLRVLCIKKLTYFQSIDKYSGLLCRWATVVGQSQRTKRTHCRQCRSAEKQTVRHVSAADQAYFDRQPRCKANLWGADVKRLSRRHDKRRTTTRWHN